MRQNGQLIKNIVIEDQKLPPIYVIRNSEKINYPICITFFFLVFGTICFFLYADIKLEVTDNYVELNTVEIISFDNTKNIVELSIEPSSNQEKCYFEVEGKDRIEGIFKDNKCVIKTNLEAGNVVFTNGLEIESKAIKITDYVIDVKEKDKYYLPLKKKVKLSNELVAVGDTKITWISEDDCIEIVDNTMVAKCVGSTIVKALYEDEVVHEINVVVTDTIIEMPSKFNKKKEYLPCKEFTEEEAKLLDEILAYRINEVGYGTRAAAVEAARFLTLEFPYRITYFYETGRLNTPGRAKVDGEGRYYHKGLYLSTSKYKDLAYVGNGPAIWGCGLRCYEDAPPYFKPGLKYPNGLSCSGFVTWVLYNAGFDVGDIGAGETPYPHQLTDLGKYTKTTDYLIKSGKIKVGDLFNVWGHISILVGEDSKNYYIAESLDLYGGVVINTYSKKNVADTFPYVVLMDDVYKSDGDLTDLWY